MMGPLFPERNLSKQMDLPQMNLAADWAFYDTSVIEG